MMRERKWLGAAFAAAVACLMVAGLFGNAAMAQEVMSVAQNMPGFKAASAYQDFGNGESVAPFNGGLTVVHPSSISLPQNMGGMLRPVRCYNSKDVSDGYGTNDACSTNTDRDYGFLGAGWLLSYGRVSMRLGTPEAVTATDYLLNYVNIVYYFYTDENGAEHELYKDSSADVWCGITFSPSQGWYLTNDGSYIKAYFNAASNRWTIFFPDGSSRVAGGEPGAYIGPVPASLVPNPSGGYYVQLGQFLNPHALGWYVTSLTDQAGNSISIQYRPYDQQTQPFAGSISSVSDEFGRVMSFSVYPSGSDFSGLLMSISQGNRTENYHYDLQPWTVCPNGPLYKPLLTKVEDAAGLQTLYGYLATNGGQYLGRISYPTGAVSEYGYEPYSYNCGRTGIPYGDPDSAQIYMSGGLGVSSRTVTAGRGAVGAAANKLIWTWDRSYYMGSGTASPYLAAYGLQFQVGVVVMTDQLVKRSAAYFSLEDTSVAAYSPGTQLLEVEYGPGAPPFHPNQPFNGAVRRVWRNWEYGDRLYSGQYYGDAHRCLVPFSFWGFPHDQTYNMADHGNPRLQSTAEAELDPSSGVVRWEKRSESFIWDGYGHYWGNRVSGTPDPGVQQVSARVCLSIINETPGSFAYQLNRVAYSYTGNGQMNLGPNGQGYVASGSFRAIAYSYDSNGLLAGQSWMAQPRRFFILDEALQLGQPATSATDKHLAITRDANGNISHLQYSGCDSAAAYGFNFTWDHGMVSRMWRDNSPYGDEFNRAIDPATSLITSHTDTNGLVTSFEYDALNRLTKITPPGGGQPGGDYSTRVYYPNDATTYDGSTWATGHDILFYVGPEGFTPDVSDNVAGMDAGAAYAHYFFDDLGRLVKTRSLHADGQLYDAVTAYDPLGAAFFTSLPYRADGTEMGASLSLDWSAKFPSGSGNVFAMGLPSKNGIHPYGGVTSVFANAAWTNNVQDLIAGDPERFYRPLWSFKPTGDVTGTAYDGLSSTVTLYGIQTGLNATSNSATTYTKDVFGRLMHVQPPLGSPADYTYDAFDHVIQANLSGQIRTWSYNALGRLVSATNPENGTTSYLKYDCIGNLLLAQDANGADTSNGKTPYKLASTYDAAGRLLATNQVNASDGSLIRNLISNTYDKLGGVLQGASLGRLVQAISYQAMLSGTAASTSDAYAYSQTTGRVSSITESTNAGGWTEPATYTPTYDLYGQVTDETLPSGAIHNTFVHGAVMSRLLAGDNRTLLDQFVYDEAGQLSSVRLGQSYVQSVMFDDAFRPIGFALGPASGGNLFALGSYADPANPATRQQHEASAYRYQYDGAGNITSIGETPGVMDSFSYDLLSRLTGAMVYKGGAGHGYGYAYDPYGNLIQRTESANGKADAKSYLTGVCQVSGGGAESYLRELMFSATLAASSNGVTNNRVQSVQRGGTIGGIATGIAQTNTAYAYDANGNLLNDGQHVYKYDALNRQVAVYLIDGTTKLEESVYNAAGERVAMVAYQGGAATGFTKYLREGAAVVYEKSFTLSGGAHSNLSEKTYLYASGRMAVTKARNLQSNIATYSYYGIDHLGTARFSRTVDANGAVVLNGDVSYAFEPFGVTIPGPNPAPDPSGNTHLYTGHERDALPDGTSIDYMHFRFYGASMGRFQKPDSNFDSPIANPQGWNLYSYVKGNPVNFNDPTGHMPEIPDRPEKPARPYGMMGGLVMGVNDSVGDQVRQAITAAEATVNTLIKNNGVAGSITVSAEFLNKLKTDGNFRYGFTMWLATPSGSTQWNRQAQDGNSRYDYSLGLPPSDPTANGETYADLKEGQNPGPNIDWKHIYIVINYKVIYGNLDAWKGDKHDCRVARQFAITLGHESYHAEDIGSGKYTYLGVLDHHRLLDGDRGTQEAGDRYWKVKQYYDELNVVFPECPQ